MPNRSGLGGARRPSRFLHVHNLTDLTTVRNKLLVDLFGSAAVPSEEGTLSSVSSPVAGLSDLDTCEKITMSSFASRPRVWTPTSPNNDLVILHQGHSGTYNDLDYNQVLQQLLTAGYTVCGMVMPNGDDEITSGSGGLSGDHSTAMDPLNEFIGPIPVAINTLEGEVNNIHMMGLSGGGWTTTMAAAADVRISNSYPIAGSLPLTVPVGANDGAWGRDWEQRIDLRGLRVNYLDCYILGSCPAGRRQKQILHDDDDCCFDLLAYQKGYPYAADIVAAAAELGGDYDLVWRSKTVHEFDTTIVSEEILTEI